MNALAVVDTGPGWVVVAWVVIVGLVTLAALHIRDTWRHQQNAINADRAERTTKPQQPLCAVIHPRPCHQPATTIRHGWPTCTDHTRGAA